MTSAQAVPSLLQYSSPHAAHLWSEVRGAAAPSSLLTFALLSSICLPNISVILCDRVGLCVHFLMSDIWAAEASVDDERGLWSQMVKHHHQLMMDQWASMSTLLQVDIMTSLCPSCPHL